MVLVVLAVQGEKLSPIYAKQGINREIQHALRPPQWFAYLKMHAFSAT